MTDKKIKIEFAPGCFDNFDGTQEELDELMAEIVRMAESGEIFEQARPLDLENPDEDDIEAIAHLMSAELNEAQRKLQ
jgi:hypothetical protein